MIARSFKSVAWVAAIGVAALVCYMFSMRVAEERSGLAQLEAQIRQTEQSIQTLKTELGTRGRVHQLQHWATADFGFTSPKAGQFLDGEVTLARFEMQPQVPAMEAPVQMAQAQPVAPTLPKPVQASAPAPAPSVASSPVRQASAPAPQAERPLLRQAAVVRADIPTPTPAPTPSSRSATRQTQSATAAPVRPVTAVSTRPAPSRTVTAKPAPRATALINERTLSDLDARSRTERAGRAAN
jgi:hypothetical protein